MKKIVIIALSIVLVASLAIGGTLSYLTSTDSDVNVLTVGNVKIDQLEYERVVDANGDWVASTYTGYGYTADLMQEYTQDKKLIPKVGQPKWDNRNGSEAATGTESHQQPWSQIGAPGSNQLFDDSVHNVQDKFVFVKNTGSEAAYFRTVIAIEAPDGTEVTVGSNTYPAIMTNTNGNIRYEWEELTDKIEVDGQKYYVMIATHLEPLAADETSRPSLLQVYMRSECDNEDVAKFGDKVDILVFTQAVQAQGFDDVADLPAEYASCAEYALTTAFGEITATAHPWSN